MAQNIIQTFSNAEYGELKVYVREGEPWFKGKEVAQMLGYKDTVNALKQHVEDEDKLRWQITTSGQNRLTTFINESGLYALILSSKLPTARQFKHWVTSVVLPQIRKTGGYIPTTSPSPSRGGEMEDTEILSRALLIAQKTIEMKQQALEQKQKTIEQKQLALEQKQLALDFKDQIIARQMPMAQLGEAVTGTTDAVMMRDLAKLLTENGFPIGQNRLFKWMRNHGFIMKSERKPYQSWVERGFFIVKVTVRETSYGSVEDFTTKITGKGQEYFINGFIDGKFKLDEEEVAV